MQGWLELLQRQQLVELVRVLQHRLEVLVCHPHLILGGGDLPLSCLLLESKAL